MQVVDDVSYDIRDREFVSVIGPSGCGKTTMMNIVAGFMQPSAGSVTLDGKPIAGPGPDRGVIFQEYGVFPWLTVKREHRLRPQPARQPHARGRARRDLRALHAADGPRGVRRRLAAHAVGRHAPAPGACARLRREARVPADGRAVRRARRADPLGHAGPAARGAGRRRQDGDAHHALGRGGGLSVQPHHRHDGAADAHPRDHRGAVRLSAHGRPAREPGVRRAARARARSRHAGVRRSRRASVTSQPA